jgi:hypothetical protein
MPVRAWAVPKHSVQRFERAEAQGSIARVKTPAQQAAVDFA